MALAVLDSVLAFAALLGAALAAVLVAAALVVTLPVGVAQARNMSRLRAQLLGAPTDLTLCARVLRGAARAVALRATIGLLSLALLALAAALASAGA